MTEFAKKVLEGVVRYRPAPPGVMVPNETGVWVDHRHVIAAIANLAEGDDAALISRLSDMGIQCCDLAAARIVALTAERDRKIDPQACQDMILSAVPVAADLVAAAEAEAVALRARVAQLEGGQAYVRTGVKDRDGREICVGDHICIDLSCPSTKKEYWKPIYEVVFKAPHFTIRHIGGDKDSDTAHFYWRVPQRTSTGKIATIYVAALTGGAADGK